MKDLNNMIEQYNDLERQQEEIRKKQMQYHNSLLNYAKSKETSVDDIQSVIDKVEAGTITFFLYRIKYSKENGINVTASLYVVKSASHKKFKLSKNRDHYLMVGTIEPRKGYKEILKLWKNKKISYPLVIIGQKGWMCGDEIKLIEELKSQGLIKWEKSCSDSKLDDYYSRSFALIQNSYYEGYGLPVLEAINNGLRVYARDISALSEFDENSIIKYKHIDGLYRLIKDNHLLDKQISFQNQRTWREASSELEALLLL